MGPHVYLFYGVGCGGVWVGEVPLAGGFYLYSVLFLSDSKSETRLHLLYAMNILGSFAVNMSRLTGLIIC